MALFDVLGFDFDERQNLADGLLDWMDEDDERRLNGFDGDDYEDLDPPLRPMNAKIASWDEFRLIHPFNTLFWDEEGRPIPEWALFKESVSLYHSGPVNVNHASDTLLALFDELGYLDNRAFEDFKNGPDGEMGTDDDRLLRDGESSGEFLINEGAPLGKQIELLTVRVTAERGEARFVLEALVTWSGSNPGTGNASRDSESDSDSDTETDTESDSNGDTDRLQASRQQTRGGSQTQSSTAASLGYPFRILRLTENRKI